MKTRQLKKRRPMGKARVLLSVRIREAHNRALKEEIRKTGKRQTEIFEEMLDERYLISSLK
jgi:hypothetical protein